MQTVKACDAMSLCLERTAEALRAAQGHPVLIEVLKAPRGIC